MNYEPFVLAAYAAVLALPVLPAALELHSRRDAAALTLDPEYAMDPRYLGKSFRRKIAAALAQAGASSEIQFLSRANEHARIVDACEVPNGTYASYAILARGPVNIGERARLADVYSTAAIHVATGTSARTVVADGDIFLGENAVVARWIDTERDLVIGAHSSIGHSASAAGRCILAEAVTFRRLFGEPIIAGVRCEAVAVRPPSTTAQGDIISSGRVEVEANTVQRGSIKSDADVVVGAGARVEGSIVARGGVRLEQCAVVTGHVFAEHGVDFGENACVGTPGAAKTVYACENVRLSRGATIYGWIICEGQGETR